MTPEQEARKNIDFLLGLAGWIVQDYKSVNLGAGQGIAIREFPTLKGPSDYLLVVDRKALGIIEAKPEGTTLSGVAEQSYKYASNVSENIPKYDDPLPFHYESTGVETLFKFLNDTDARSRNVFGFHKPETLKGWIENESTLRNRLRKLPDLNENGLWDCQIEAITNLEKSLAHGRPKALIQMATGSGKTFTSVSFVYRLIKYAGARRVLFLVDRNNLGRQTMTEFSQYITPDDGRKFTELYNVQHLKSNIIDPVNRVVITTIQRLYSMLKGEEDFEEDNEEKSLFDVNPDSKEQKEVSYNRKIPIETFDFIITDECHRSIYNLWSQVLDYFDAFLIGLTATPSKQTLGYFDQNLVQEYPYERAVADNVNVDFEVYKIETKITKEGSKVNAGFFVDKRDKLTRKVKHEKLDEEFEYQANQLDRTVVAKDQIRKIIQTFQRNVLSEIFPYREHVPKTLVFAKDDSHAEDIVHMIREEFGKGDDFCKKITYRTTGESPEELIKSFRNSYNPRIAVTVDMVSTGTDIKPIEILLFMRDVKSPVYFEQMKGRGTRVIKDTDLRAVTPDADKKTHFIIVDAVGVTESPKNPPDPPLERKRTVPFEKLLDQVKMGVRDEDIVSTVASRLSRLSKEFSKEQKEEVEKLTEGKSINFIVNRMLDSIDPDKKIDKAKELYKTEEPTEKEIKAAFTHLANEACRIFDNTKLREKLIEIKKQNEQVIDIISVDEVLTKGFDERAKEKAKEVVSTWKRFIEENKDEITALQIIYSNPVGKRKITYNNIKELAKLIEKPPYNLKPEVIWHAYEQLEKSKVKRAGPKKLLTNLISLIKYTIGEDDTLKPFNESVDQKYYSWIMEQEAGGKKFTADQLEWLEMLKNHIASSLNVDRDDFELSPFYERGGLIKVYDLLGDDWEKIVNDLNNYLIQ